MEPILESGYRRAERGGAFMRLAGWLLAMVSCALPAPDPNFGRNSRGLIFDGDITVSMVQRLDRELVEGDTLWITSERGDPEAGLMLAEIIQRRHVTVAVNGECIGICATYAFLPAAHRNVGLGHALRFRKSPFVRTPGRPAAAYAEILATAGVSPQFLHCVDAVLSGELGDDALHPKGRDAPFLEVAVSREVLSAFGVATEGDYVWYRDAGARADLSEELSASMTWLDDPRTCGARR